MRMKKSLNVLAALALLALPVLPAAAQSTAYDFDVQKAAGPDARSAASLLTHPKALARFLHLSAEQAAQLQTLWNTLQTTVGTVRDARAPLCQQLRADLTATPQDPQAVGTAAIALYANKQQIAAARQTFDTAFSALLTPGQLNRYNALKQIAHLDGNSGVDLLGDCPPAAPAT
jgi:Spy/CpxP family protein refolding chaperone